MRSRTQRYRERVASSGVRITWTKVQAHTGEYGNTRVDYFARHAATHHAFFPELPVSILPAHFRRSRTAPVSCR
jgi:ribonuclease HI